MKEYPVPKNAKQVKRFLGMSSYYRKFIPNYSKITEPINRLLKKNCKFVWTELCETNFQILKSLLINPPILVYPNFAKKFIVTTDASGVGLGAILSQLGDDGLEHPICYASRLLNVAEKNYSATELECLGIVWAIEHFRPYLYGREFLVKTDHNPLVYLNNTKNKSSRVCRWRLQLSEYKYEIEYKKGVLNTNADALSRVGEELEAKILVDKIRVKKEGVRKDKNNETPIFAKKIPIKERKVNFIRTEFESKLLSRVLPKDIIEAQKMDDFSRKIIEKLRDDKKGPYFLHESMLYIERNTKRGSKFCLVIPSTLREVVFRMCHDDMGGGHLGMKKCWPKVRDRFYWPSMYQDLQRWLKACVPCAKRKTPKATRISLSPINEADKPFDMVGMDLLGPLPETPRGNKYICVFSDYNSRWPEGGPLKNKKTTSVAKLFIDEVVSRHGAPKVLLSDQGGEFMSDLVKDICAYLITSKVNTTAYHPQTNGLTERFNATLCQIISIYVDLNQQNWDELLPLVLFAYRTAIQESTTISPFDATVFLGYRVIWI